MKINAPTDNSILTAYDQRLAQFLSPDPFVQAPENTQSYNRYAYCMNNPFKYTDPSGYRASNSTRLFMFEKVYAERNSALNMRSSVRIWGSSADYFRTYRANYANSEFLIWVTECTEGYVDQAYTGFFAGKYDGKIYTTTYMSRLQELQRPDTYNIYPDPLCGTLDIGDHSFDYPDDGGFSDFYYQTSTPKYSDFYNFVQTAKPTYEIAGNIADVTSNIIGSTKIGSDIAYKMAYSGTFVKGMNTVKSFAYVAGPISMFFDVSLSMMTNPETGEPYQTWGETALNIGVTATCMAIGGTPGLVIGVVFMILPGVPKVAPYIRPYGELQDNTRVMMGH